MVPDAFNDANHEQIITLVAQHRLPAMLRSKMTPICDIGLNPDTSERMV
jgi:hypothetical protein